jgi:hypothetical protein
MWPGGARGTPGKVQESSLKHGNTVQCVSEKHRKALMSRKCSSTCTKGAAVHGASMEYSTRCVQRAWESARVQQGWQSSTEHRERRVGQLSGKCTKSVI